MCGTDARQSRNTVVRLVSMTLFHSSRVNSVMVLRTLMPALLMRICTPPYAAVTSRSTRATWSSQVTSATNTLASPPAACASFATAFNCSWLRETRANLAPAPASASAMALPRPLLAPVIRATLPWSFFSIVMYPSHSDSVGRVDNPVSDRLRSVDIRERQPAGLTRRLNREVPHAAHPLSQRLPNRHVLHLRELDRSRG